MREIFAIGDAAIVLRPDGQPVPGIAPAAKQEGVYVADVIRARLRGAPAPPPFRYKHAGDLATIGKRRAVIDFGWIKLRGALAWWLWGFAHIYFLIGVRNRLSVASTGCGSTRATSAARGSSPGGAARWRERLPSRAGRRGRVRDAGRSFRRPRHAAAGETSDAIRSPSFASATASS